MDALQIYCLNIRDNLFPFVLRLDGIRPFWFLVLFWAIKEKPTQQVWVGLSLGGVILPQARKRAHLPDGTPRFSVPCPQGG